jgi:hypothetical protein
LKRLDVIYFFNNVYELDVYNWVGLCANIETSPHVSPYSCMGIYDGFIYCEEISLHYNCYCDI